MVNFQQRFYMQHINNQFKTNLPKEIMGFPEFPIPKNEESYIPAKDILKLIDDYATHYNVKQHIKALKYQALL
ncbi:Flavin-containing monooxygenase [Gryllus bimaculatus]|nr:Flavin-containing monooxygenase [Gryllus bimaculatus]